MGWSDSKGGVYHRLDPGSIYLNAMGDRRQLADQIRDQALDLRRLGLAVSAAVSVELLCHPGEQLVELRHLEICLLQERGTCVGQFHA